MIAATRPSGDLHFLSGGGEMGALTRSFNWSATPLGAPGTWPQSLRLTLSMILSSRFPMFLWWGEELIQFYNDAYRPSLGNDGKHPVALGQKAEDCWPEIWHIIHPLIKQVIDTQESTWSEDQLIPIYRNGQIEDVYWTFGYSPIMGEAGKVDGVLVVCTETTEKIRSKKALEESEQRFRMMAESMDMLIASSDETGNAKYFNNAWTEFTGRTIDELLNFGWADLIHEEDREGFVEMYMESFKKQANWTGEFRMLDKNGEYRWLLAKAPARFGPDGAFVGYISSSVDITDQKNNEYALRGNEESLMKSEQQMRTMVESAPFAIAVYIGPEMRIEFANQSIIDIWGKGNDVIGKSFKEILPELDNQEVFKQIEEVFKTGQPFHIKNQRLDLVVDNVLRPFYFNYSFTPLFDTQGHVYGVMNTGVDLTDLNMAKMAIQKSEENLRNTILQAPVAMCMFRGPKHFVELANERMFELWGKPADALLQRPIFEGLPEAKNQGFEEILNRVYTTGNTFSAHGVPITLPRNGKIETVYVNFVYEAYREADGSISGILAVALDVTEQMLARQKIEEMVGERTKELATANSSLQKSNAELAQFAYIASHDLQEPLRKISTFTQMLENRLGDNLDEQSKKFLGKINSSSIRMNALIRDVLSYSELVKEKEIFSHVDLNQVIESTITDFELLIEQKEALIEYKNLPVLEAIPLQMSQLFGNIIGNSLKFARKEGKPVITVSATELSTEEKMARSLEPSDTYYNIRFTDNGIGFKPEYATQIFNIFQRLHRKSDYEGTGIGLAMCKKIALNHHGDLDAEGSSENGAVFNAILPARHKQAHLA